MVSARPLWANAEWEGLLLSPPEDGGAVLFPTISWGAEHRVACRHVAMLVRVAQGIIEAEVFSTTAGVL